MDPRRLARLSEMLREELRELISFELEDPRLDGIEVVEVHLSPDGKKASIQLIIPGNTQRQEKAILALQTAKSFIKMELSERIELFRMPELYFEAALAPGMQGKMSSLFKKIRKGRPRDVQTEEKSEKKTEA